MYDQTQGGRFLVRAVEAADGASNTGAEYVDTRFEFVSPPLPGREVWIDGRLTDWLPYGAGRMAYDSAAGAYTATIPLKQGAYDYRYVTRRPGESAPDWDYTEGNHHQSRRMYTVYVYYRKPGERYDRLAGVGAVFM